MTRRADHSPALALAAVLLLLAVPIVMVNSRHSGDGLKIRRELRKF